MKTALCKNNEEAVLKDPIHGAKRKNNISFSGGTADFFSFLFTRKSRNRMRKSRKKENEKHEKPYGWRPYLDINKIYHTKRLLTAAKRTKSRM